MRWQTPTRSRSPAELVLFIIWPSGEPHARRLMRTILDRFQPLLIRSVQWRREGARQRLCELYGRRPEALFEKDREVGEGECTVVISVDHRPRYVWCKKTSALANRALLRFKRHERRRIGFNCLHASDTEYDALQFATHFFEQPIDYYLHLKETALQSAASPAARSLHEVFDVLNECTRYAVLRNWRRLPHDLSSGQGDVDILVDDPAPILARFPGSWNIRKKNYRVNFRLPANAGWSAWFRRRTIPFDVYHVGDQHFEEAWKRQMLHRRVCSPRGFYHLADNDHFDALLYHVLLCKPTIRDDYRKTLRSLGRSVAGWSDSLLDDRPLALEFLASRIPAIRLSSGNRQILAAG